MLWTFELLQTILPFQNLQVCDLLVNSLWCSWVIGARIIQKGERGKNPTVSFHISHPVHLHICPATIWSWCTDIWYASGSLYCARCKEIMYQHLTTFGCVWGFSAVKVSPAIAEMQLHFSSHKKKNEASALGLLQFLFYLRSSNSNRKEKCLYVPTVLETMLDNFNKPLSCYNSLV